MMCDIVSADFLGMRTNSMDWYTFMFIDLFSGINGTHVGFEF